MNFCSFSALDENETLGIISANRNIGMKTPVLDARGLLPLSLSGLLLDGLLLSGLLLRSMSGTGSARSAG